MNKIAILLSSFNGEKFIVQQIESLLKMEISEAFLDIYIRDDGSKDRTVELIKNINTENNKVKIILKEGGNLGVVKSFFSLLNECDHNYDYVAFCDQDDIWLPNKIKNALNILEEYNTIPAMQFTRLEVVDENLNYLFLTHEPSKKIELGNAIVENIATGCTVVINNCALRKLKEKKPNAENIVMHDWWVYLVISATGKVLFNNNADIKYRQHSSNVEGMMSGLQKILNKFIKLKRKDKYPRMSKQLTEFLQCYSGQLNSQQISLVDDFKKSLLTPFGAKAIYYVITSKVYRQKLSDNCSLIFSIIFKRL
jgi:glycosyltransferase involved in cell wall biosynthesis